MAARLLCGDDMPSPRAVVPIVFAALSFLLGCSSTSTVTRPDRLPQEQGIAQATMIVGDFAGKEVKVELESPAPRTGARYYQGTLATSAEGKGFLLLSPPAAPGWVAFENTRRITYTNRLWGAGEGFLIGTASGILLGLLTKASFENDSDCSSASCWKWSTPSTAELVLLEGGIGAVIGTFIGLVISHRKIMSF
jgi:hypothetical protein